MGDNAVSSFMKATMENMRNLVDVDTVVGEPIRVDDTTIIPVSKISFGFAAGGSEFEAAGKNTTEAPFGGGSGGGISVSPIAFLIVNSRGVELKHLEERSHLYEKLLDQAPKALHQIIAEFDKHRKGDAEI